MTYNGWYAIKSNLQWLICHETKPTMVDMPWNQTNPDQPNLYSVNAKIKVFFFF